MSDKQQPLGVCDHCLGPIHPNLWYTTKGQPRHYCSLDCRNTANSRAGAQIRSQKIRARIAAGAYVNPAHLRPPTSQEQAARARKGRIREVVTGAWRNPALGDQARQKLSRPRKHAGVLHRAIEKLRHGKMADLTGEERQAYLEYRRQLRQARRRQQPA